MKIMCGLKPKKYHRPYLIIEPFHPNEYVAGCVSDGVREVSGQFCFDLNHDGMFDWGPDERGYLSYPLGAYEKNFYDGKFKITEKGRYIYNGGETYLYVGGGTMDDPGLTIDHYDYSSDLFIPIYYANVDIKENYSDDVHSTVFYYTVEDGFSGVTNVS
jgi:hypothetical protein